MCVTQITKEPELLASEMLFCLSVIDNDVAKAFDAPMSHLQTYKKSPAQFGKNMTPAFVQALTLLVSSQDFAVPAF
jgi:hypothetical protein